MKKDRHAIHLLKGKCYDRKRHYSWAVDEYECALLICKEMLLPDTVIGSILFRKGWSRIRAKKNIERGLAEMKEATRILPDNIEVLMKLANAIFQYSPESKEDDELIFTYLNRIKELDPRSTGEALHLMGKVYHRQKNYHEAISKFEESAKKKLDL